VEFVLAGVHPPAESERNDIKNQLSPLQSPHDGQKLRAHSKKEDKKGNPLNKSAPAGHQRIVQQLVLAPAHVQAETVEHQQPVDREDQELGQDEDGAGGGVLDYQGHVH
jgi:hypothetical protein